MRYQLLGEHTGIRVSEMVLGAGRFGAQHGQGADLPEARRMFDYYLEAGGNFIDVSESYQSGQAESFLGEMLPAVRDDVVLASKFTHGAQSGASLGRTGNSRKAMVSAVEGSLRRLKTDRIDLYWAHMPDGMTPVEEIARGFEDLSRAGKILYGGLSNFPAWRTAGAAVVAELRGWAPIAAQTIEYNLLERSPEQELLPMAGAYGLATTAWSPLGGGMLTGKYRQGGQGRYTSTPNLSPHGAESDRKSAILDALDAIAAESGSNPGRVALAWVLAKGPLPVIGPRTFAQLEDNLGALEVRLSQEQIVRLDSASAIPLSYPHDLLAKQETRERFSGGKYSILDLPARPVR